MSIPPALPETAIYTSCYCEENIYFLAKSFIDHETYVVFVSNENKTVAIWNQKRARSPDIPVVWDYHVILVLKTANSSWIYDFDAVNASPILLEEYMGRSFLPDVLPAFRCLFRVVPSRLFFETFSSDRSHMICPDGTYSVTPPTYPAIQSVAHSGSNLMDAFVSMDSDKPYGEVMSLEAFTTWGESRG
ncbi:hypothetical protein CYLTODRAFT_398990 [Cylindrobasidium torrendii FP15055 ss-10]|uniref:Protein N-terminal glutamine amidohydrolase n=1 Tax=Cylindrobasidium torrendii FP15055 ss-10 TaxID=1314674 RepID=A0A0D7B751_9AGAR|nr:hypothetical protein CYLTODRAFT_398990 [Cylindrobasidium torrendii FP15055 ss-10]